MPHLGGPPSPAKMPHPLPDRPRWDDHDDLPLPTLAGDAEAELCVVGLGGTGLSCLTEALALGATSVIGIDAVGVAAGAAGRNGGLLLSGTSEYHHDLVRQVGRERAVAITRLTNDEIQRIAAEVPDDVRFTGSLRIAASDDELADCEAQRDRMLVDGFPCDRYTGPEGRGLLIPTDAVMQPLRRCRRIAARALTRGARLFGGTRALELDAGIVRTDRGTIRARHVIVCVDGRLESLVPALLGTVRTARLQMLATAPAHEVAFPRPVSTRQGYDYWQQLPDGCVLLGGGRDVAAQEEWTTDSTPSTTVQDYLTALLRERLGVHAEITHRWGAAVSYSDSIMPLFRDLGDGVRVVGAYNGTGNVVGALLGRAAAQCARHGRSAIADPFTD
jgi:gamma-glutamylputrescine oxidase